jgi:recombination protein RecR
MGGMLGGSGSPVCSRFLNRATADAMPDFAEPLANLIQEFKRLPGIGQKSAQRLAFHVLRADRESALRLAQAVLDVKDKLGLCGRATTQATAASALCRDPGRNRSVICVVEEPHNIIPIETTRTFEGLYHVLHGSLAVAGSGRAIEDQNLLTRLEGGEITEIILATNPTVEGEATASYLSRLLKPLGVKVTRIAMGIPVGSDLEFADEVTMSKSLENRREM